MRNVVLLSQDQETIIAPCTPTGSGALALLRLSGDNACEIAARIGKISAHKTLASVATHTVNYGHVIDDVGAHIDQVMFLVMHAPKTFTGQNVVEITCHNNPFIVDAIMQQAIKHGARIADNGEFTKRAMMNGKIDLIQAEAINELINAQTHMALKKSLAQLEGSFSHWLADISDELTKALALCEASFEFLDEEELEFGPQVNDIITTTLATIAQLKKNFNQQQQIRQGIRIALVGSVNAGKSSLFNALLGKKRAIVSAIAGTTRDAIEAGVYRNGNFWTLIDTAGLRQTQDSIEQEGIKKSFEEAQTADIVLMIIDSSRNQTAQERAVYEDLFATYQNKCLVVYTKTDCPPAANSLQFPQSPSCHVSSASSAGLQELESTLETTISSLLQRIDAPFLLNQRQYNLMLNLEQKLHELQPMLHEKNIRYELVAYHLRDALANLCELTGKTITEQGMDRIFKEFCVGK